MPRARMAPRIGATHKSHKCDSALAPTKRVGPVRRAGLTETWVVGMPMRWTGVRANPMAIPAEAADAFFDLAPIMTVRKMKV